MVLHLNPMMDVMLTVPAVTITNVSVSIFLSGPKAEIHI
jgi:hypothetical protein